MGFNLAFKRLNNLNDPVLNVLRSPKIAKLNGRCSEVFCGVTKLNTERNNVNKRVEYITVCKEGE